MICYSMGPRARRPVGPIGPWADGPLGPAPQSCFPPRFAAVLHSDVQVLPAAWAL